MRLFHDPVFQNHRTDGHPESPERLAAIDARLRDLNFFDRVELGTITPASVEDLARVHTREHIDDVREFSRQGGGRIDADTIVCPESYDVALLAAGSAIAAVDTVLTTEHRQAATLLRPPGHHALADQTMGFCLFGNTAIAARYAQSKYQLNRILIVDWDVHHGNGTQAMFYEDPNVYFFSVHRWPFFPGTGSEEETGHRDGLGTTFNLPLQFGVTQANFLLQFERMLKAAAEKAKPELVLISAGFDAHYLDPVGSLGLETVHFGELTRMVNKVAAEYCEGRVVSVLEGGYQPQALADSVACHLQTLLDNTR